MPRARAAAVSGEGGTARGPADFGVARGGDAPAAEAPDLLDAGVYTPRPVLPLAEAVHRALGRPSRADVREGVDLSPVWRRPRLHARLVEAMAEDAARSGAGRITALGRSALAVAASVARRLRLPLERPGGRSVERTGPPGRPERSGAPYLVACLLHDSQVLRLQAEMDAPGRLAGVGTVLRLRDADRVRDIDVNILSIIDLTYPTSTE